MAFKFEKPRTMESKFRWSSVDRHSSFNNHIKQLTQYYFNLRENQ